MAESITEAIEGLIDRTVAFRMVRLIENGELEMNRLQEKLAKAAGVVQRQSAKIEARADALIAREEAIEQRTDKAFEPHETLLDGQEKGLDRLEASLRLLSNGAPLEPSTDSQTGQQAEPVITGPVGFDMSPGAINRVDPQTVAVRPTGDQRTFDRLGG